MPFTGIFINKKLGWLLICSYFYFLLANWVFEATSIKEYDNVYYWIIFGIGLIFIIPALLLMNHKKIRNFYSIEKANIIKVNIYTSTAGFLIALIVIWIKNVL